jgi:hypothetical protein
MPSSSKNIERYTPKWVFDGLDMDFDLDPAAPEAHCPSKDRCASWFTKDDDGLSKEWCGRVWLNPPWTRGAKRAWVHKLYRHGNGIALVRGGVDSKWLHDNPPVAILLLRGRVNYLRSDEAGERYRKGGAKGGFEPSMLLAYGESCAQEMSISKLDGIMCNVVWSGSA